MKKKRFFGKFFRKSSYINESELKNLNIEKKDMIKGIVELSETTVKDILVPRIDTVFLSKDMPIKEILNKVIKCGHSRIPVYKETIDQVIGILYVKDLLAYVVEKNNIKIETIIRKPYFVPESKRLDALLREFKRLKVHIAISVDEYGGVSGIVCMEDIIEEIIGDIQDEFDNEIEEVMKIGDEAYLCDARINLTELNEKLDLALPEDDFDTLGGFVFDLFGKIPVKHEKVSFNANDFIIQDMDGHKIKIIKIMPEKEKDDE